jgi:SAM-dependent methyltransferase
VNSIASPAHDTTPGSAPADGAADADDGDALAGFLAHVRRAFAGEAAFRLVLSKPRAADGDLRRVTVRPVRIKGQARLNFVDTHRTRDLTSNLAPDEAQARVADLAAHAFAHAQLSAPDGQTQLLTSRKGRRTLLYGKARAASSGAETDAAPGSCDASGAPAASGPQQRDAITAPPLAHDRAKRRYVDIARPFLVELGVTDERHALVPAMARKWKQINKFVEVLDHALADAGLSQRGRGAPIEVLDFGSGKGYLTFAMHEHLRHALGLDARVTGVELREDMVALCNDAARRLALEGLRFERGDVGAREVAAVDVMVALHACDTATDHAIHKGIRAGAAVILCAPCCHKELRPQLGSPAPLRGLLRHGVHKGQQAEMLTDALRALLLDACGYDTQVFEFVSLEHTSKNKMILAVRRGGAAKADAAWAQVRELKDFYGIREQCLERLLLMDRAAGAGAALRHVGD